MGQSKLAIMSRPGDETQPTQSDYQPVPQQAKRRRHFHSRTLHPLSKSEGGIPHGGYSMQSGHARMGQVPVPLQPGKPGQLPSATPSTTLSKLNSAESTAAAAGTQASATSLGSSTSPLRSSRQHVPQEVAMQLEARRQLLEANPDLMERRKALSQAAFVRHDTSELMSNLKHVAARLKASQAAEIHRQDLCKLGNSHRRCKQRDVPGHVFSGLTPGRPAPLLYGCRHSSSNGGLGHSDSLHGLSSSSASLPVLGSSCNPWELRGCLKGGSCPHSPRQQHCSNLPTSQQLHDEAVAEAMLKLDEHSVPGTPIALRRPPQEGYAPLVPGTLNGIGHPLLNDRLLLPTSATQPRFALSHPAYSQVAGHESPISGNDAACEKHRRRPNSPPKDTCLKAASTSPPKALSSSVPALPLGWTRTATLDMRGREQKSDRPLSDDTLNLWRGKRLNLTERKIEAQLHRLRNNPTARAELQNTVEGLMATKADEVAEVAALQLLASEQREQKALTFLKRQSQYHPTRKSVDNIHDSPLATAPDKLNTQVTLSRRPVVLTGIAALFDPHTGEAVEDPYPLPRDQHKSWVGYVTLSRVLHALSSCLDATSWARQHLGLQEGAARTIQARWKGYQARKLAYTMKSRKEQVARMSRKMQLGMTEESATQLILIFLEDMDLAARRKSAAVAIQQIIADSRHEKTRTELIQSLRVAMLVRQWDHVEAAAIELYRKRVRGMATLGVQPSIRRPQHSQPGNAAASKPVRQPAMYALDKEAAIQAATEDAMARTNLTDRILLDDGEAVPQPVKVAVVTAYLEHKVVAYNLMVGLLWKARTQWKAERRKDDARKVAQGVMETETQPAASDPVPDSMHEAYTSDPASQDASQDMEFAQERHPQHVAGAEGALIPPHRVTVQLPADVSEPDQPSPAPADLDTIITPASKGSRNIGRTVTLLTPRKCSDMKLSSMFKEGPNGPRLPPFRILGTPMEMKAIMQQGVQETAAFSAYLLKGKLGAAEQRLTSLQSQKAREQMEADSRRTLKQVQTKKMSTSGAAAHLHAQHATTFTVALLLHRWRTECMPRANACLNKRYTLLKVNLAECLANNRAWTAEELGQQLQNLVLT